jgi:hypothetical protein
MRKVGALCANWNGDPFLIPHLKMLRAAGVDRILVSQGPGPWGKAALYPPCPAYAKEHDGSRARAAALPFVEVIDNPLSTEFCAEVFNPGLRHLSDCDIVLKLDSDMLMMPADAARFVEYIRGTAFDCYHLDFKVSTIDYSYDYDHGTKTGVEFDIMAVAPQRLFTGLLDYPAVHRTTIAMPDVIHHFRGWKGHNSWVLGGKTEGGFTAEEMRERYGNNGDWFHCPELLREAVTYQCWTF